ncbi:Carbon starvation protein CstA [Caprobacter fermentans]|uniref:Carbon starvation protein A n=1 Tax=Caproicibacter fermentans TaxID=2576756 RepID=A0A6N8I497_9FIRM|nr:carbon starvation CstA family protein [Caproicibacter fermentans]MVB12862.1 Carbon starvation protein CstA [Caproicibacter fermentans]OCN02349.1 carbon starvation protein CstA [Clostridium sp. W14A]QNK41381.1 carbon starvation protein A [Caproicibacter fermentans]
MITFFVALVLLIVGYLTYGKVVDKVYQPYQAPTPCVKHPDGVDYIPLSTPRAFLIQLLNIAGLGPIFGALSGALWGPVVYFWIVLGSIFAGGVHDYTSGILSIRNDGASISEIVGIYLGKVMLQVMRVFSVILLVLIGATFTSGPAGLIAMLTPAALGKNFWLVVLIIYYFTATLFPIDKIIGKLYPIFGILLIIMCIGVGGGTLIERTASMPEMQLANLHPAGTPIWSMMFITVACGACSGFHSTQSPLIARCVSDEKEARKIFYGAMISEGVIALIWAAAGMSFYNGGTQGLYDALKAINNNQSQMVYNIGKGLLGPVGVVLTVLGVGICPITSADTAFRSARLTIADWFHIDQTKIPKRLAITIPLLGVGAILTQMNFSVIWRYFSFSNQTLAMIVLWAGAAYLCKWKKSSMVSLMAAVPATFMSAVTSTYFVMAPECLHLSTSIAYPVGIIFAIICVVVYVVKGILPNYKNIDDAPKVAKA